jgi:chemotaxis protein MotB
MANKKQVVADPVVSGNYVWMVTFSDLVMLLLTFFVLLLSMSSMDTKKLKRMFAHFKGSSGSLEFSGMKGVHDLYGIIKQYEDTEGLLVVDPDFVTKLLMPSGEDESQLDAKLDELRNIINILDDNRGIVLSIQENLLFESGESTLRKEIFPVLATISKAIESCPNDILIMGHTDDVPIKNTQYDSNWELSSYRGLAVLDYFIKDRGLPPSRFTVGGYGPSKALYSNNTANDRALNRRVEIIFRHTGEE